MWKRAKETGAREHRKKRLKNFFYLESKLTWDRRKHEEIISRNKNGV